jgi:hypothetical protein
MLFPLVRAWLKPLFGSAFSSNRSTSKHPSGFRTIGGGVGESSRPSRRRQPASSKQNITSSISFTESEERIVDDVKMQHLGVSARQAESTRPPSQGIMVVNEFEMVDDKINQNSDQKGKQVHESW